MHHRLSFNSKLERFMVLGHFCRQLTLELSSTSKGAAAIETPPCAGDTAGSETGSAGLLALCGAGSAMSEVIVWASLLREDVEGRLFACWMGILKPLNGGSSGFIFLI